LSHAALGTEAHARLSTSASDLMALTLGIFSLVCLFAAASGTRFRPHADLRDTYLLQAWALIPVVLAVGVFAVGIVATVPWIANIETVVVLISLIVGLGWTAVHFYQQAHRLTRELVVRAAEEARREQQ